MHGGKEWDTVRCGGGRRAPGDAGAAYLPLLVMAAVGFLALVLVLLYSLNQFERISQGGRGGSVVTGKRPNVVLISIDSLRADHLHCYGYHRETSPNLDRLAAEGVLFETVCSTTSWTLPSHMALLTGLPDQVHQVTTHTHTLSDRWPTLAQLLKKAGYVTAGFFSGPYLHPLFGFDRGFDVYRSCIRTDTVFDGYLNEHRTLLTPAERKVWNEKMNGILSDRSSPRVRDAGEEWLTRTVLKAPPGKRPPFFLFLHFFDVHYDYVPPPAYDRFSPPDYKGPVTGHDYENNEIYHAGMAPKDLARIISLYDGEILWVDHHVGELLRWLESKGLREDTVVAVVSDHGDEFFEHGAKGHRNTNGLFNEVIRIPFILSWPEGLARGRRVGGRFRIIDVMPTLLELAGCTPPRDRVGVSMLPYAAKDTEALRGRTPPRLPAVSELTYFFSLSVAAGIDTPDTKDRILALRDGGYNLTWFLKDGRTLLFDENRDPEERKDLSGTDPERTRRMLEALKRQDRNLLRLGGLSPRKSLKELDPQVLKQLRDLGYVK